MLGGDWSEHEMTGCDEDRGSIRDDFRAMVRSQYQASGATSILTESRTIPRDSKEDGGEDGPWVLVLYQEEWAAEFQADSGPIPGNS